MKTGITLFEKLLSILLMAQVPSNNVLAELCLHATGCRELLLKKTVCAQQATVDAELVKNE